MGEGIYNLEITASGSLIIRRLGCQVTDVLISGATAIRIQDMFNALPTLAERNAYIDGVISGARVDATEEIGRLLYLRDGTGDLTSGAPLSLGLSIGDRCVALPLSFAKIGSWLVQFAEVVEPRLKRRSAE